MKLARALAVVVGVACVTGATCAWGGEDPPAPPAPPIPPAVSVTSVPPAATKPAKTENASAAAVSPEARTLLDEVDAAYGKLKSLELAGTVSVVVKVEGEDAETHATSFTASYLAPNKFRHEAKEDVLLGGTGAKLYTYRTDKNAYTLADAPKDRVSSNELPKDLVSVLGAQNPSLMLAVAKSAAVELLDEVSAAEKVEDTKVGETSCPTLKLTMNDKGVMRVAVDPETHLVRQTKTDITEPLKKRRPDLVSAVITTDYATVKADGEAKAESFAWAPPVGAADAAAGAEAQPLEAVAAASLEGKTAPGFKLPGTDGKTVSLASLKGQVVVIDFWATWCGPCKLSLPHLDKMYQAQKADGVAVFAIDEQEDLADVKKFVAETKLGVPVLLDRDGKVGEAYGVEGIPQTVVIGKDGKVRKIFVGFGPNTAEEILKAVETAKKG